MTTPLFPTSVNPPDQAGYQVQSPDEYVQVELEGGTSRTRRDKIGTPYIVTCSWSCTPTQFTTIWGFFRERLQSGVRTFRVPLKIDVPALVPYRARLIGKPQELVENRGLLHTVKATLEVLPNPIVAFGLICQAPGGDYRVIAGNNPDFNTDMDQFPIGRDVMLTGVAGIVGTTPIDLDGTYTILGKPSAAISTLVNAPAENAGWTTLEATTPFLLTPTNNSGACILLPE